tara:strand:- start:3130 stop:4641 length:1512 start_codon:yes stop_codon:yes gene_type:complete
MGFNAKAFGAALATELSGGIKERFKEAKEFKKEEKEKAERNLTIFQKRIAQKDAVMTYANTLKKLGATNADIMYFAKDGPAVLKSIHDTISEKAEKYYELTGNKLSPETVSKMMNIPKGFEEAASKYKSIDEFLNAGYRLSQENDEFEQPENEEILAGNFLLGIMGVGAKERVRRKLETEKFIGDTTIGQLNRIAAQRDFVDVFGGEFSRAALDPTIGPRILDSQEVADVKNDTNIELIKKTTGNTGKDNLTAFLVDKLGEADVSKDATAIFLAMNDPTKEATELTETQRGYLKEFKEKMLYDAFIEESAGMNLKPSEVGFFGSEIENIYKKYSEKDKDDSTTEKKKDEVGGEVKKDKKIMSLAAQQLEMKEQIANGTLKPGDVYIFTNPKDGSTEEVTVPEVKTDLEQKVEAVQTSKPMDKEAFDGLPDRVASRGAGSALRFDRLYGTTHNRNGIKKSYDQYVQDFVNNKLEQVEKAKEEARQKEEFDKLDPKFLDKVVRTR